jgi:thiamine pyrophosphate-dependent acetolactate synthase large subunit-like protein
MPTVRTATYDVLRRAGLTTIFGNPGSNELTLHAAAGTGNVMGVSGWRRL